MQNNLKEIRRIKVWFPVFLFIFFPATYNSYITIHYMDHVLNVYNHAARYDMKQHCETRLTFLNIMKYHFEISAFSIVNYVREEKKQYTDPISDKFRTIISISSKQYRNHDSKKTKSDPWKSKSRYELKNGRRVKHHHQIAGNKIGFSVVD